MKNGKAQVRWVGDEQNDLQQLKVNRWMYKVYNRGNGPPS
jgi:hypothetical protein